MHPTVTVDQKALKELESLGFERLRTESGERVRLEKHGCAVDFQRDRTGKYGIVQGPGYLVGGEISRLWDAGFQKFLLTAQGRQPATTEHLKALHHFEEELRTALRVTSLYNLSLGTTCVLTAYDRVQGRPE